MTRQVSFKALAAALQYVRAGAILDTLRAYSRQNESPLPEPGAEDQADSLETWEMLQTLLPNRRERRLAYVLYHCGLKPREIVQQIYHMWRNMLDRLMRIADQLRWLLGREVHS